MEDIIFLLFIVAYVFIDFYNVVRIERDMVEGNVALRRQIDEMYERIASLERRVRHDK